MSDPFNKDPAVTYGAAEEVAPGVRRITCENPSPYTFTGTQTYLVLVAGFEVDAVLGGRTYRLILRQHDVRARDFRLLVDDGRAIQRQPTPPCVTYRGIVDGHGESDVAIGR